MKTIEELIKHLSVSHTEVNPEDNTKEIVLRCGELLLKEDLKPIVEHLDFISLYVNRNGAMVIVHN